MKKKALWKDFFMEIRKSLTRFISIFFIVALGVAFFSGIQASSPDMRYTGDAYYDSQELMDIKIVSTLGLNEENRKALEELPGVLKAESGVGVDVLTGENQDQVLHVETLTETLNQITVTEGRLPETTGECLLDETFMKENGYEIGDQLVFSMEEGTEDGESDTSGGGDTVESDESENEQSTGADGSEATQTSEADESSETGSEEEELMQVTRYTIVGAGHSPLYISFSRGNTTLGSGEVNGFAYVTRENFTDTYDTQVYLQARGSLGLTSYTDAYDNLIEKVTSQVEGIEQEQCQVRYDQVRDEAQEKVDDARQELEDGRQEMEEELASAWQDIEDAQKELEDGRQELADGEAQLQDARDQVASGQSQLASARQELADGEAQLADAREQYQSGKAQLDAAYETLSARQTEADEGKAQLDEGKAQLDAAKSQLDEQWQEYQNGLAQIEAQEAELSSAAETLEAAKAQYEQAAASGEYTEEELAAMLVRIQESEAQLTAGQEAVAAARAQLEAGKPQLDAAQSQLDEQRQQLEASQQEYEQGAAQLAAAWEEYHTQESQLQAAAQEIASGEAEMESGRQQIAATEQQLSSAQAEITSNEAQLEEARQELEDGEQELADGIQEYEDGKAEAEVEIADAEEALDDAQQTVDEIEQPEWIISDRDDLPEYADYGSNADRIRNIGEVFPVMFFLVAALISLTTMTRMVEEQRTQIGTMKALGYSKFAIISKYLNYAFLATVGGSILGILFGEKVLPFVIIRAYGIMYHNLSDYMQLDYEWKFALIASGAAIFCTIGATVAACIKALHETPAALMRPPAPKEGKRVLLERAAFIWKHLSFTWKSTVRNLFRYKKRFFMTIFGIGGCMALLLVGYGLRDSIMDIANLQYQELQTYDAMIVGDEDASEEDRSELLTYLDHETENDLESYTPISFRTFSVKEEKVNISVYLYAFENPEALQGNVVLRDRKTQETFDLTEEGAVISEKTATLLDIGVGDTLKVEEEGSVYEIPVAGITENYMGHYIYLTESVYREVFQEDPVYQDILLCMKPETTDEQLEELGVALLEYPAALSISYTSNLRGQLDRMLESLDTVMIVLIVSAGMLAFVVLYNLNNINITERKRELATLKVLGFYDMEVCEYVFRENMLLTILGAAAGAFMGILLHRYVIVTVEVDAVMFGRNIYFPSFVRSILYTVGFSLFVNFIMYFKLKKIDMVESLKSVE